MQCDGHHKQEHGSCVGRTRSSDPCWARVWAESMSGKREGDRSRPTPKNLTQLFKEIRQNRINSWSDISRSRPARTLHRRLAIRLRRYRSNTSTEYAIGLPGGGRGFYRLHTDMVKHSHPHGPRTLTPVPPQTRPSRPSRPRFSILSSSMNYVLSNYPPGKLSLNSASPRRVVA